MTKIYIDGSAGTTGLRIRERLAARPDLQLIEIDEALRKDPCARSECLNNADVAFLCLPDAAAIESAALVTNPSTVVIDTSTAHRTDDDWTYGFPELNGQREKIAAAHKIANPGCHASGFIALVAPLVAQGLLRPEAQLSCFSLTGYSGGGKKMIADYETGAEALRAPRMYGLSQQHKHLPEMAKVCALAHPPVFCPTVSDYYAGMEVVVPLFAEDLRGSIDDVRALYRSCYADGLVTYSDADESGFLSAGALAGYDNMFVGVFGNADRAVLVSRFDNLGKGASGAAIQNMNLVLGLDERTGLNIYKED